MATPITPSRCWSTSRMLDSSFSQRTFCFLLTRVDGADADGLCAIAATRSKRQQKRFFKEPSSGPARPKRDQLSTKDTKRESNFRIPRPCPRSSSPCRRPSSINFGLAQLLDRRLRADRRIIDFLERVRPRLGCNNRHDLNVPVVVVVNRLPITKSL